MDIFDQGGPAPSESFLQPGRAALAKSLFKAIIRCKKKTVAIIVIHQINNYPKVWDDPVKFETGRWKTGKVKNRHEAAIHCSQLAQDNELTSLSLLRKHE